MDVFKELFRVIEERKQADPSSSYVASLFQKGTSKINKKVIEEAYEVCEAAQIKDKNDLNYEICDLLFHAFVLASHKDITLDEISSELSRRFGISGIEEKKNRKK